MVGNRNLLAKANAPFPTSLQLEFEQVNVLRIPYLPFAKTKLHCFSMCLKKNTLLPERE